MKDNNEQRAWTVYRRSGRDLSLESVAVWKVTKQKVWLVARELCFGCAATIDHSDWCQTPAEALDRFIARKRESIEGARMIIDEDTKAIEWAEQEKTK